VVGAQRASVEPWLGAMMVLLAFAGTTLAVPVLKRMDDASFRLWTRWTVIVFGLLYLGSGIALLL
jgi:hypothetical protein